MPSYSNHSRIQLDTCHADLQVVFGLVINYFDHRIIEGHRDEATQNKYYADGLTQVRWPNSAHNKQPSMAVDVAPWPINWGDRERMHYFAGYVKAIARTLYELGRITHLIRWGGDWDNDTEVKDNSFDDLIHFELYKPGANS